MKTKDLIEILNKFDPDAYIAATWEGIVVTDLQIYLSVDGVVLIDAEGETWNEHHYKKPALRYFEKDIIYKKIDELFEGKEFTDE